VIIFRPLQQGGDVGGLFRRQLVQRLAEVVEGGRAHTVRAVTEVDLVHVELEDLLLVERLLQPARQHRLLQLAADGDVVGQEDVLGDLLGDGRPASSLRPWMKLATLLSMARLKPT
jgi:hypothetical protein